MFRLQLSMEARVAQLLLLLCVASPLLLMSADQQGDSLSTLQRCTLPASPPPSFFVFGASMVDAGTNAVAMPFRSQAEFDPYGSDYFDRPTGRWSNGRTFMDIMTQSLGLELLYPYVQSIGSNFTYGVNFASSGSTAQNTSSTATDSGGLFSLLLQVEQFQEYQNILLSKHQDSKEKLKIRRQLSNSIYFFETAHNDYLKAGLDSDHLQVVKLVMDSMRQAFEGLYNVGAKNFIVMNVIPLGCTPMLLSITTTMEKDEYSCTRAWNEIVKIHNRNLEELLNDMHVNYPMAKWILFDAYNIFLDGFQNPSKYGRLGVLHTIVSYCKGGEAIHYEYHHDILQRSKLTNIKRAICQITHLLLRFFTKKLVTMEKKRLLFYFLKECLKCIQRIKPKALQKLGY